MLLDNTQLIRGIGVKTPDTQLVRKGYAARGLMGFGFNPSEELTDAMTPEQLFIRGVTPIVTRRPFFAQAPSSRARRQVRELTALGVPRALYSTGAPIVTRRGFAGLGDDVSAPGATSSNVSTLMTAVNSEIGYLVNLARAQQGKAPLPDQLSAPAVRVGIDTSSLAPLAPVGVALVIGWFILGSRRRRRR